MMGFWGGVRDWINNLPWTDQNYLDQQRNLAEINANNEAVRDGHPISDWYDTSSTWPSGDDDYDDDGYPGEAPYNSGSDFPTGAQEDAYAQGLVLSPAAAEVWARGSGPDPADGPITQADVDEFEREVAGGAYDPANYPAEPTDEERARWAEEDRHYQEEADRRQGEVNERAASMSVEEAREIAARDRELHDHISGCNQDVGNCSTCSAEEAKGWAEAEADATDSVAAERRLAREEREREQESNDGHDNGREGRDDEDNAEEDDELADEARAEEAEELAWHDEHEAWLDEGDEKPAPDAVPTDLQPDGSMRDEDGTTTAAVADAREAAEEQAEAEQAPARTDDSNDDDHANDTAAGC